MSNKSLFLILKREWYELILSGKKDKEYRDRTKYYESRFRDIKTPCECIFQLGYSSKDRLSCIITEIDTQDDVYVLSVTNPIKLVETR